MVRKFIYYVWWFKKMVHNAHLNASLNGVYTAVSVVSSTVPVCLYSKTVWPCKHQMGKRSYVGATYVQLCWLDLNPLKSSIDWRTLYIFLTSSSGSQGLLIWHALNVSYSKLNSQAHRTWLRSGLQHTAMLRLPPHTIFLTETAAIVLLGASYV